MRKTTLIIDKRKELPTKYKRLLEDDENSITILSELNIALKFIQDNEPDLIIISDSLSEELSSFCSKIRVLTYNMRPVIVALSKSSEIEDKVKTLENGADDFISEPINHEEFKMRIKAHLRRQFETYSDNKNHLPNQNYSLRAIKRTLNKPSEWAALSIKIENFYEYQKIYTELATDKLIQTFIAIMVSALDKNDFLGCINENEFLILTNPLKLEKIAPFLIFAFDSVCPKFYSQEDLARGYILTSGDENYGQKVEFLNISIGAITSEVQQYKEVKELLSALRILRNLAKTPNHSNYLIQRQQLSSDDSILETQFNKKVVVIEDDKSLSLLLKTALELKNYDAFLLDGEATIEDNSPAVVILDAGKEQSSLNLELCKSIKASHPKTKLIVTSIYHDKERILNAGADFYLPKPYNITDLVKWVDKFIKDVNY